MWNRDGARVTASCKGPSAALSKPTRPIKAHWPSRWDWPLVAAP
jgi:hypothetical protein